MRSIFSIWICIIKNRNKKKNERKGKNNNPLFRFGWKLSNDFKMKIFLK